jgi:hypothetical protein
MIEVKINLVPFGDESEKTILHSLFIVNTMKKKIIRNAEHSEYYVTLKDPRFPANKETSRIKFYHRREHGALECIKRAIMAVETD